MSNLTDFLLSRIAEDEYDARTRSLGRGWRKHWLGECEAKRRIVQLHDTSTSHICGECGHSQSLPGSGAFCRTSALLALPYADHPDYNPDWRP